MRAAQDLLRFAHAHGQIVPQPGFLRFQCPCPAPLREGARFPHTGHIRRPYEPQAAEVLLLRRNVKGTRKIRPRLPHGIQAPEVTASQGLGFRTALVRPEAQRGHSRVSVDSRGDVRRDRLNASRKDVIHVSEERKFEKFGLGIVQSLPQPQFPSSKRIRGPVAGRRRVHTFGDASGDCVRKPLYRFRPGNEKVTALRGDRSMHISAGHLAAESVVESDVRRHQSLTAEFDGTPSCGTVAFEQAPIDPCKNLAAACHPLVALFSGPNAPPVISARFDGHLRKTLPSQRQCLSILRFDAKTTRFVARLRPHAGFPDEHERNGR